jgi:hypothetical protein
MDGWSDEQRESFRDWNDNSFIAELEDISDGQVTGEPIMPENPTETGKGSRRRVAEPSNIKSKYKEN